MTGVRWAESAKRKNKRGSLEIQDSKKVRNLEDADNKENEKLTRFCPTKGKHILNPIIDWSDDDVWEFIKKYNIPYCVLYDRGYKRLGCIGCPMSTNAANELNEYPKYKKAYLKSFARMLEQRDKETTEWKTAEEVMDWWLQK